MVSINITQGQGLTQALKAYAQSQNYDTSDISSAEWGKTIDKLKEIQANRISNNQEQIFSGDRMIVHQGPKTFSDSEIESLYQTMGLGISKPATTETEAVSSTKSEKTETQNAFDAWTKKATLDETTPEFKLSSAQTIDDYNKDIAKLAEDYIKLYDKDGDGNVSSTEYKDKEIAEDKAAMAEAGFEASDEEYDALYTEAFNTLNVDDEGKSKGVLTKQEFMNYFFSMDAANNKKAGENEYGLATGSITVDEFNKFRGQIVEGAQSFKNRLKTFYNDLFKNYQ